MYCEECRIKIDGKASLCPLCHKPVINDQEKTAFPIANPKQKTRSYFVMIYAIIFVIVVVPSIILNLRFQHSYMWSIMVLVMMAYIFFFVRYTVLKQGHFRQRLIGQTIFLTLIFFVVKMVTGTHDWILIAWLPALYITCDIILVTHMMKFSKYAKKNVISTYLLGILGVIPVISAYAFDLELKIPSIVASGLSVILIICISIIFRKTIITEVKKFFHI